MSKITVSTKQEREEAEKNRPPTDIQSIAQSVTDTQIESMEQGQKQSDLEIESTRQGQQQTDLELRLTTLEGNK